MNRFGTSRGIGQERATREILDEFDRGPRRVMEFKPRLPKTVACYRCGAERSNSGMLTHRAEDGAAVKVCRRCPEAA